MQTEFSMLKGERLPDDAENKYRLYGLPAGADFRREDSYEEIQAGWLKVEGVGFSADAFEFSQHGVRVLVEQEYEGGPTLITFEKL